MAIFKATANDVGCYVDGHWGQYAIAHMIERATEFGWHDAELERIAAKLIASIMPNNSEPITDEEYGALNAGADEAEQWLNDNVAPEGYSFGWHEGEFFLWSDATWAE